MPEIDISAEEPPRRAWDALMAAHIAAFTALGYFCAASQRYLFADGSLFFLGLLKNRAVADWFPTRHFAHWLTQFPAVMLLQEGECRDVKLVGFVYGASLFLMPVAGLAIAWWAARKAPAFYLVFPMLSHSILYLTTSMVMFVETFPAVWLFWCLLYLLLFSERLTLIRSVCLIVFAVLATRTYENYLFLAWPLLLAAFRRGRAAWAAQWRFELLICIACGLLFFDAFGIAADSTFFPRDAGNRSNFAQSLLEHVAYSPARFGILVIGAALWCLFFPARRQGWRVVLVLAAIHGAFVVGLPMLHLCEPWAFQYASRVQALYIPLVFGGLAAWNPPALRKLTFESGGSSIRRLSRLAALTCVVSVLFQWTATLRWNEYRVGLLQELSEHRGVIPFEESVVYNPIFGLEFTPEVRKELLREFVQDPGRFLARLQRGQFSWGWATPSQSVALSALNLGSISAIVCAPISTGWQPFDPRKPDEIPDLTAYGVRNELAPGAQPD